MAIRTIFTDLGNVVSPFDRVHTPRRLAKALPEVGIEQIARALHSEEAETVLRQYSTGKCTNADYAAALERVLFGSCDVHHRRLRPDVLLQATIAILEEPNWRLIRQWKYLSKAMGVRIVALTDITPEHLGWNIRSTTIEFDGIVASHEVGACKPDARMWDAAMAIAQAEPRECLYVDDLVKNVDGFVRTYGVHGHVYDLQKHEDLEAILARLDLPICPFDP